MNPIKNNLPHFDGNTSFARSSRINLEKAKISSLNSTLPYESKNSYLLQSKSSGAEKSCFQSFCSWIFQWFRSLLFCFFASNLKVKATKKTLTAQELEERIEKGRQWINDSVKEHFENKTRKPLLDKFLVRMSYNGMTVFAFPTTFPVDFEQLKKDAAVKLEAMLNDPKNKKPIDMDADYLDVRTIFLTYPVNVEGKRAPFIRCGTRRDSRDFRCDQEVQDNYATDGKNIERADLYSWLNKLIPNSTPDREAVFQYASGALNWFPN